MSGLSQIHGRYNRLDQLMSFDPPKVGIKLWSYLRCVDQGLIAELVGTYMLIFAGCASIVLNVNQDNVVTLPGIASVWGLVVMVLIYSVGHVSGAHFNPAVTIAFATCKRFPWNQVPAYILVQVIGSTLASGSLRLIFNGKEDQFVGTVPAGTNLQALILEFIATFYLMFVIVGVATDDRAMKHLSGVAIGATVSLDILFSGPLTGASMNPARSLGPAIVTGHYKGLWIYIIGPTLGAIFGAWTYNLLRLTNKSWGEAAKEISGSQKVIEVSSKDKVICNCGEGWSCIVSKTEEAEVGNIFFECAEGCLCIVDETNTLNKHVYVYEKTKRRKSYKMYI
ncbi:nodulin-26-like isoform X2 [Lycium ferocissimum]|uniref:nodulin-26-like isoform X2 n=1 Tax=Lycium ferocissimum TaxID=112874 RepID=UPI002814E518|nr:nodulin-26-like isoform X2 [Lycium ferocissimum]